MEGEQYRSVTRFLFFERKSHSILVFGREIAQRNQRAIGCCVRWLFSFEVARRFLNEPPQGARKRLPRRITWHKTTISSCVALQWLICMRSMLGQLHCIQRGMLPAWCFVSLLPPAAQMKHRDSLEHPKALRHDFPHLEQFPLLATKLLHLIAMGPISRHLNYRGGLPISRFEHCVCLYVCFSIWDPSQGTSITAVNCQSRGLNIVCVCMFVFVYKCGLNIRLVRKIIKMLNDFLIANR